MVYWDFHHIRKWERRSFITFGHSKIMESLIMLWLVLVLPQRKWVRHHMLCLEDITHLRSLEVLKDSSPLRISLTGLEHGHLRVKE